MRVVRSSVSNLEENSTWHCILLLLEQNRNLVLVFYSTFLLLLIFTLYSKYHSCSWFCSWIYRIRWWVSDLWDLQYWRGKILEIIWGFETWSETTVLSGLHSFFRKGKNYFDVPVVSNFFTLPVSTHLPWTQKLQNGHVSLAKKRQMSILKKEKLL